MSVSPYELTIAMHYRTTVGEPDVPVSDLFKSVHDRFIAEGILTRTATSYRVTTRGRAWLASVLSTPFPITQYVDPRTKEVLKPL